jgi:hypothetical protein
LSPAQRKRIEYDIESLYKAINGERYILNRSRDTQEMAFCAVAVTQLYDEINRLRRRIQPKRVADPTRRAL